MKIKTPKDVELLVQGINTVSLGLDKILNITFGIAQIPLLIVCVTMFLFLLMFIYLIW